MPHIVCLRPLHPDAMARLHAEPDFKVTMLTEVNTDTLREPMQTADAIIVRATPINRDFLANAPMRHARCKCAFSRRTRHDADAFHIAAYAGL